GCSRGDGPTIQAAAQLRANAARCEQARAHSPVKSLAKAIQVLLRRAQAKIFELVRAPMTPELRLPTMHAERAAGWQAPYIAKDGLFDRDVGQREITCDVILVYLRYEKRQLVQTLR